MGTCGAVYFEANGVYVRPQSPNTSEPVYFASTDPRDPGFPPPEDEAEVGNPRVQSISVCGLRYVNPRGDVLYTA